MKIFALLRRSVRRALCLFVLLPVLILAMQTAAAQSPNVVVSIKPLHSLVSGVMQGVAVPSLLIDGVGSPHGYALKPSQAVLLTKADLVFWIAPNLETFLTKPLRTLAKNAHQIAVLHADGMTTHPLAEGDHHGEHSHEDEHHEDEHHEDEHAGKQNTLDPHMWLDPQNAQNIVALAAEELSKIDSENMAIYQQNAQRMQKNLQQLDAELRISLTEMQSRNFMMYHDAFQYFIRRYGLKMVDPITLSPESQASAHEIAVAKKTLRDQNVVCIFGEPQFSTALIDVVREGTTVQMGMLDPLGAGLDAGADQYYAFMQDIAKAMRNCLQ